MDLDEKDRPAWQRPTEGEHKAAVVVAILVAIALMLVLPERVANQPRWLVPSLAILLMVMLLIGGKHTRFIRRETWLRVGAIVLIAVLTIANAASALRLIIDIMRDEGIHDASELLMTGGAIWVTNVIVFALWYWEGDRGGPAERRVASRLEPDFLFPQMTIDEPWTHEWEPKFVDYLYFSFTNATAFSPTDVMPLARWAKLTMMAQSAVSIAIIVLVVADAVNTLN
jgi:uncharacterized membrane protein